MSSTIVFAQYDAECFIVNKEKVKEGIKNLSNDQLFDSVHFKDTLLMNGVSRFVDTIIAMRKRVDISGLTEKVVGCTMPNFSFFTTDKEDLSIEKIKTDFTILSFGSSSYGDVPNARLYQFCKLKTLLKDSLTVINIYEEVDAKVIEYSKMFPNNVEYVANADVLVYKYTFGDGGSVFVLDKYKNILYVKSGYSYINTPDEIYNEILDKIRATKCPN